MIGDAADGERELEPVLGRSGGGGARGCAAPERLGQRRRRVVAEEIRQGAREELEDDALGAERLHREREDLAEALGHVELAVAETSLVRKERRAADDRLAEADRHEDAAVGRRRERAGGARDHRIVLRELGRMAAAAAEQVRERRPARQKVERDAPKPLRARDDGDAEPTERLDLERDERLGAREREASEAQVLAEPAHARLRPADERRGLERPEQISEPAREAEQRGAGDVGGMSFVRHGKAS